MHRRLTTDSVGLRGAIFLSNLRTKTIRGVKAAVPSGRLGGGCAYGYHKVTKQDADGRAINGVFEIEPTQAEVVRRINRDFAAGQSSIQIATALNLAKVPGPRGGEWNASTIRGDPKKLVGILNNPLYVGKLVWGRREWRKNPDSDRRERRYRLRDQEEWVPASTCRTCASSTRSWRAPYPRRWRAGPRRLATARTARRGAAGISCQD